MANPGTAYDDPRLGKDPQGASMDEYVDTNDDNGGVHLNSGIPNRAFHLAATAIGGRSWEGAGAIWYAALTGGQVGATTDFAGFAAATVAAAGEHADAVRQAWETVGVAPVAGSASTTPTTQPGAGETLVHVRRTGGFAGRTAEGSVDLASHDARVPEVRTLVDRIDLARRGRRQPAPRHVRLRLRPLRPPGAGARAAPHPGPVPAGHHRAEAGDPSLLKFADAQARARSRAALTCSVVQGRTGSSTSAWETSSSISVQPSRIARAPASQSSSVRATTRRRVASTTRPCTSSS